jgi:hypothetical protein
MRAHPQLFSIDRKSFRNVSRAIGLYRNDRPRRDAPCAALISGDVPAHPRYAAVAHIIPSQIPPGVSSLIWTKSCEYQRLNPQTSPWSIDLIIKGLKIMAKTTSPFLWVLNLR